MCASADAEQQQVTEHRRRELCQMYDSDITSNLPQALHLIPATFPYQHRAIMSKMSVKRA